MVHKSFRNKPEVTKRTVTKQMNGFMKLGKYVLKSTIYRCIRSTKRKQQGCRHRVNQFVDREKAILLQDGTRPRSPLRSYDYFENVYTGWPSNTPNLNPIENVWLRLKERSKFTEP